MLRRVQCKNTTELGWCVPIRTFILMNIHILEKVRLSSTAGFDQIWHSSGFSTNSTWPPAPREWATPPFPTVIISERFQKWKCFFSKIKTCDDHEARIGTSKSTAASCSRVLLFYINCRIDIPIKLI